MARRSDPEVIDLVSSSDEEDDDVVDVDGWTAVEHVAGFGAGHAAQDEDDAAMALRLQEEEYRGGPVAPPAAAAAAQAALAEPVTDLDWTRRYRSEQDAEYEASLATDRAREAQARAAATAAQAEAAAAERAAAAAKAEADAVEAAARDAAAAKTSARDRWLAAAEPPAGAAGVISVAIRFPDGTLRASVRRLLSAEACAQARAWHAASRLARCCSRSLRRSLPSGRLSSAQPSALRLASRVASSPSRPLAARTRWRLPGLRRARARWSCLNESTSQGAQQVHRPSAVAPSTRACTAGLVRPRALLP